MDKIKQFFAKAFLHRFWIMLGLAVVVSSGAWYMTQSNLNKLYTDQETLIKNKYSDLERVRSALPTHPNQSSKTEMERIIGTLEDDVKSAWDEQYQRQAEYMRWPDIGLTRLVNKLKDYYPIELHPKLTYPDEAPDITEGEKTDFAKYFDEQMPRLAEIIGVEWVGTSTSGAGTGEGSGGAGGFGMSGSGGGRGDDEGMGAGGSFGMGGLGGPEGFSNRQSSSTDVVIWPKPSQDELLSSIRLWNGDKPNVYQMIYTQENIWILEGLLNIIAKTNIVPQTQKPATANVQATVKQIEFIRIGSRAIGDAGDVMFASGQSGAGGLGMGGFGMGGGFGMDGGSDDDRGSDSSGSSDAAAGDDGSGMSMGGGFGMGGMGRDAGGMGMPGGATQVIDPANRRYVDASFQPITGDDFRTKIKSESPEDAYFAVAKRVPVRLRLTMDMRRFQEFLANCGNEGMMLEVRQVRLGDTVPAGVNGGAGGLGGGGGLASAPGRGGMGFGGPGDSGMEGAPGGRDDGGGGMGRGDMDGGGTGFGMGSEGMSGVGGMRPSRRASNEMKIEVYGTVYLFYPVNIDRLGLSKVDENTEVQDSVETPAEPEPAAPSVEESNAGGTTGEDASAGGAPDSNGAANSGTGQPDGTGGVSESDSPPGSIPPSEDNPGDSSTSGTDGTTGSG